MWSRRLELIGIGVCLLASAALSAVGTIAFVASVNAGYDSHENRAPALRTGFAAAALLAGIASIVATLAWLRRPGQRSRAALTALLIAGTVALLILYGGIALATGPL
jgi:hypothetical protein